MDAQTEVRDWIEQVGKPAYSSIAEMVACLQADRDRLEDLRDERASFLDDEENEGKEWASEYPEDAAELAELESAVKLDGPAYPELSEDEARERIEQDALSVRVFGERIEGEWQADNYEILIATGGPAVRIVGDLDQYGEASSARLEVQDWFKPWSEYHGADHDILLAYAQCFYFGE